MGTTVTDYKEEERVVHEEVCSDGFGGGYGGFLSMVAVQGVCRTGCATIQCYSHGVVTTATLLLVLFMNRSTKPDI